MEGTLGMEGSAFYSCMVGWMDGVSFSDLCMEMHGWGRGWEGTYVEEM